MGRAGEVDKKRRLSGAISPTADAASKKQPFAPLSEEKKLDAIVLQFQNKKLKQKLETQKVEIYDLEKKKIDLENQQKSHEKILSLVNDCWEKTVDDLESRSKKTLDIVKDGLHFDYGDVYVEDALLSRLLEKEGAAESSTSFENSNEDAEGLVICKDREFIFSNILAAFSALNYLKHVLYLTSANAASSHEQSLSVSGDVHTKARDLRIAVLKLHLKHKSLAAELQDRRDTEAKNKAHLKHLKGEVESNAAELEESNCNLAVLYEERDAGKGAFSMELNRKNNLAVPDKVKGKQTDEVQDMEGTLKELVDQSESRMHELKHAHEERICLLDQLSQLQRNLKNSKIIYASQPYLLLKDQLAKAKADFALYQSLCEEIQVEKENLYWKEREIHMKNELADILHVSSAVSESRISELEVEIQRYVKEKTVIDSKLHDASKYPGRQEIISRFKDLVSTFPERMGNMQNELALHKDTAADIHRLRAAVSLSSTLDNKVKELETLSYRSVQQRSEIQRLQAVIQDLKLNEANLKHFVEMCRSQSTDSREVNDAKISEIKAWAHVQRLQSCLDERNLELRVKNAIEAEAKAQQRLAASEAEIVELRQKLESSKREKASLTDALRSKHEETEAYLSEIETIGQAYDDMQSQNQQLLQQVTEIDDYNIKLVLEGLHAKQIGDSLLLEKRMLERSVHHSKKIVDFYDFKAGGIEDQV
ncbi:hypothetical protein M569_07087, partial [Genlisea aurea]